MAGRNEPANNTTPTILAPRCSHCGQSLEDLGAYQWQKSLMNGMAQALIFSVYCPNAGCHKLLQVQIFFVPAPAAESAISLPS